MEGKIRMNLYLDVTTREKVEMYSKKLGVTMNGFLNVAINDYIKQQEAFDILEFAKKYNIPIKEETHNE